MRVYDLIEADILQHRFRHDDFFSELNKLFATQDDTIKFLMAVKRIYNFIEVSMNSYKEALEINTFIESCAGIELRKISVLDSIPFKIYFYNDSNFNTPRKLSLSLDKIMRLDISFRS